MAYTRPPDKLHMVFDALYKQLNFDRASEEFYTIKMWKEVVGAYITKVSQIEKIERGILYVKVKNAAWRNELTFKKTGIVEEINKRFGKDVLKDIIFK
jgi:predicted nucleic acid-binding Zn ribbon protein